MLNINALENEYKAAALAHFRLVCVVGDSDIAFDVIFCDFIGVHAIAEFYGLVVL